MQGTQYAPRESILCMEHFVALQGTHIFLIIFFFWKKNNLMHFKGILPFKMHLIISFSEIWRKYSLKHTYFFGLTTRKKKHFCDVAHIFGL